MRGVKVLARVIAVLILALLVLLASVAVAELGLRLLPVQATSYRDTSMPLPKLAPWPDPDFRNREYEVEKRPGVFRILVLGDSYTWGHGLHPEDAYPDRLERRLGDLVSEREFEVVNWSKPGWSTDEEWHSIRNRLEEWSPDLLILGFVFNDPELTGMPANEQQALMVRPPEGDLGGWLYRHSRVVSGFHDALENRRVRERLVAYYHGLFEDPDGWRKCHRALRELAKRARSMRIPFLVVVFPIFDSQLDGDYRYHELHEIMRKVTERLRIPVLDLLPAYQGIDANRLALVPFTDAHPSELAHRIAADEILAELLRKKWIPASRPSVRPRAPKSQAASR